MGLTPGSGGRMTRSARERRAYQLVLLGSATGVIAVVGFVLALFGAFGFAIPFVCAIIAVVCLVLFRRTVGGA